MITMHWSILIPILFIGYLLIDKIYKWLYSLFSQKRFTINEYLFENIKLYRISLNRNTNLCIKDSGEIAEAERYETIDGWRIAPSGNSFHSKEEALSAINNYQRWLFKQGDSKFIVKEYLLKEI